MKKYKLLKDLPFAKAGEIFELYRGGVNDYITLLKRDDENEKFYQFKVGENVSEMFDEWFEEVEEESYFFHANEYTEEIEITSSSMLSERLVENLRIINSVFETREEAEKYLAYLKAKAVIKEDAKGFKPDWSNNDMKKYFCYWDYRS